MHLFNFSLVKHVTSVYLYCIFIDLENNVRKVQENLNVQNNGQKYFCIDLEKQGLISIGWKKEKKTSEIRYHTSVYGVLQRLRRTRTKEKD